MDNKKIVEIEAELFVKETKAILDEKGLKEGDYCILLTADQVTMHVYKTLDRFLERVGENSEKFNFYRVNWQVCAFD